MSLDLNVENRPYAEILEQAGSEFLRKYGWHIDGVGLTGFSTVWGELVGHNDVVFPAAEVTAYIKSTDNVADILGSTGAEKVSVTYMDDTFTRKTVVVNLNGTTLVQVATDFYRFVSFDVTQSNNGANDSFNVGQLDLYDVGGTINYAKGTGGYNRDTTCIATIPAGFTGLIKQPGVTQNGGVAKQQLRIREPNGVWQVRGQATEWGGRNDSTIPAITVPAGTDIELKGDTGAGVFNFQNFEIILIPTT